MRSLIWKGIWFFLMTMCVSCGSEPEIFHASKPMMGTVVSISVVSEDPQRAYGALDAAFEEIARVESIMSVFREDSEVNRVNREASFHPVTVSPELFHVIEMSAAISRETHGAFDISVGPLMKLWPFYKKEKILPSESALKEALSRVGYRHVVLSPEDRSVSFAVPGMALDLGGIAKGYAIDRAVSVLKKKNVRAALVNAGGDIFAYGTKPGGHPWWVGIQHPRKSGELVAALPVRDKAVVTSGDYERYFTVGGKRFHHIVDPRIGFSAVETASVTVIADSAVYADGLATGLAVLGPKDGLAVVNASPNAHALILTEGSDGGLVMHISKGFPDTGVLDEASLEAHGVRLNR